MKIRSSAEDAGWTIREAAWGLEERVLWPSSERARDLSEKAAERAQHAVAPLQRLIQTKLTWPLSDALRERGTAARAGIATAAAATAIAAGVAGATLGAPEPSSSPVAGAGDDPSAALAQAAASEPVLQGTAPEIEVGQVSRAGVKAPPPPAAAPAPAPSDPPARVAWKFANAFVLYEVGRSDAQTAATFAETADPALAKSLDGSPPRLPNGTKVPEARVLNVVLAEEKKDQVTASVSLARLRAVSEIRLSLTETEKHGWRVVQVLG